MSESVRTVTPELPKAIPTHLIGDHLSSGASVQSFRPIPEDIQMMQGVSLAEASSMAAASSRV